MSVRQDLFCVVIVSTKQFVCIHVHVSPGFQLKVLYFVCLGKGASCFKSTSTRSAEGWQWTATSPSTSVLNLTALHSPTKCATQEATARATSGSNVHILRYITHSNFNHVDRLNILNPKRYSPIFYRHAFKKLLIFPQALNILLMLKPVASRTLTSAPKGKPR